MKKVFVLMLSLLVMSILTSCIKNDKSNELQMTGSYYDNIDFFKTAGDSSDDNEDAEITSDLVKSYFQGITYEIVELDKDNKFATVNVSVPDLTKILPQIISDVLTKNPDATYDELLSIVQSKLEKELTSDGAEKNTTTLDLPIEEKDGKYLLIYNEQWEEIVFGSLEEMYLDYYRTMIGGLPDETP